MLWFHFISKCLTADGRLVIHRKRVATINKASFLRLLDKWNRMGDRKEKPTYEYAIDQEAHAHGLGAPEGTPMDKVEYVETIYNDVWDENLTV